MNSQSGREAVRLNLLRTWLVILTATVSLAGQTVFSQPPEDEQAKPGTFWSVYADGWSQLKQGEMDMALASFKEALEIQPGHTKTMVQLARLYLKLGQLAEAEEMSQRALSSDITSAGAHFIHGRVMHSIGSNSAALVAYKKAIELDGYNAYAYNNLGLLYIHLGHYADAVAVLRKATDLKGDVAFFFNNLGIAYEATQQLWKARESFKAALMLDPNYGKSRTNLHRIKDRLEEMTKKESCC